MAECAEDANKRLHRPKTFKLPENGRSFPSNRKQNDFDPKPSASKPQLLTLGEAKQGRPLTKQHFRPQLRARGFFLPLDDEEKIIHRRLRRGHQVRLAAHSKHRHWSSDTASDLNSTQPAC